MPAMAARSRTEPGKAPPPQPLDPFRPVSAGLSAWESDGDAPADLLEYLGKAETSSTASGSGAAAAGAAAAAPRSHGPLSGDGNLTQALILARQAAQAEAERRASHAGTAPDNYGASTSGEASSAPAGVAAAAGNPMPPSAAVDDDAGDQRRGPSPVEGSAGAEELGEQLVGQREDGESPAAPDDSEAPPSPNAASPITEASLVADADAAEGAATGEVAAAASPIRQGSAAREAAGRERPAGGSASGAAASGAGSRRSGSHAGSSALRGLLDSDDESGDGADEEFLDLMTADDDALFGGRGPNTQPHSSGSKTSRGSAAEGLAEPAHVQAGADADAAGESASPAAAAPVVPRLALPAATGRRSSSIVGGSVPPFAGPALAEGDDAGGDPPAQAANTQTAAAAQPPATPPTSSGVVASPGAAELAHDAAPMLGSNEGASLTTDLSAAPQLAPSASRQPLQSPAQSVYLQMYQAQQQQFAQQAMLLQQHHQAHYAPIPTHHMGGNLPLRANAHIRPYTPGQTNRSPVRGSGYFLAPPGRPASPPPALLSPRGQSSQGGAGASPPRAPGTAASDTLRSPYGSMSLDPNAPGFDPAAAAAAAAAALSPAIVEPSMDPHASLSSAPSGPFRQSRHASHPVGGGFHGAWAAGSNGGGSGASGAFGRQLAGSPGGPVYRSLPISQVPGSATEDGAAVPPALAPTGRPSSRHHATAPPAAASLGLMRDRRTSAPAAGPQHAASRPYTSPPKLRSAHATVTVRAGDRAHGYGGNAAAMVPRGAPTLVPPAPHIVGGIVMHTEPEYEPNDPQSPPGSAALLLPRGPVVPALPLRHHHAIRQCGFMQGGGAAAAAAAAASASHPLYGSSPFFATRARATDGRANAALLVKVLARVAAREPSAGDGGSAFGGSAPHTSAASPRGARAEHGDVGPPGASPSPVQPRPGSLPHLASLHAQEGAAQGRGFGLPSSPSPNRHSARRLTSRHDML